MIVHEATSSEGDHWMCIKANRIYTCYQCKKTIHCGEYVSCSRHHSFEWCIDCDIVSKIPVVQECVRAWKRYERLEKIKKIKNEHAH